MLGIPLLAVLVKVGLKGIWSCWCPETSGTPTTASEYDTKLKRSIKHRKVIEKVDPNTRIRTNVLD